MRTSGKANIITEAKPLRPVRMKHVLILDGPYRGEIVEVPKDTDSHKIGFWLYKHAGRKDNVECYARLPKSRPRQRFIMQVIQMYGKHPAMMHEVREPVRSERRAAKKARHAGR